MKNKFRITLSCEDANHVCDKSQYREASLWEKVKLSIHLLYCRACREYTDNNAKVTEVIDKSQPQCLYEDAKKGMQELLQKELDQHQ